MGDHDSVSWLRKFRLQLERWDRDDPDDPPRARCGCPLSAGSDSVHKFGCSHGLRGRMLRITAVREVEVAR
jgi:hypothetical protein